MRKRIVDVVAIVMVAVIAIAVSLWLTPMQSVHAVGQTVRVGAAAPSLSWSGPGEVDVFGQHLDTMIDFPGPIRPRLELTQLELSGALGELVDPTGDDATRRAAQDELQNALVDGWRRYLIVQVLIVVAVSLLLMGAIAGWQRRSGRASITLVLIGVVVAAAANVGAVVSTAFSASDQLRAIGSIEALVGAATVPGEVPKNVPPAKSGTVIVIGDSTAAGIGNPPLANPTPQDTACERTSGSFAVALDRASDWQVANLACSSATIRAGLLGEQERGGSLLPPQLPAALGAAPSALVISVGANDVGWSRMVALCAAFPDCGGKASDAYFKQQLETFTRDYLVLLTRLRSLPNPPTVVINTYYDPLPGNSDCVRDLGITDEKSKILHGWLDAMNTVLKQGADAASFPTATPSFAGHGLCAPDPFVQPIDGNAPLHPTTAGGLAIALADQAALIEAGVR
ncbi:GDSL-type esterase/lipase family protein [Gordonia sp. (in: high G+C Gram-positive bacteria)]|uniref:GDSL-type esterase/lipase family protein n=1 Tax=Gordonia sp. (in: high G+C Gram-positive bacteria) TaxID=84139 RepID=UPI0016B3A41A|nr:GDSL-type esterase/lipase family protein [Gordonia sp. (in: high G+C Gram-positive bacteria)]NLG46039.1 SGNH/GDSL hydrolase family protein [Gordonia sp. (in: high G+C Gram-positive bacteria)]